MSGHHPLSLFPEHYKLRAFKKPTSENVEDRAEAAIVSLSKLVNPVFFGFAPSKSIKHVKVFHFKLYFSLYEGWIGLHGHVKGLKEFEIVLFPDKLT